MRVLYVKYSKPSRIVILCNVYVGVCIDTCHIFASGYDIRSRDGYERTIEQLDEHVGIENVGAFHLNDSKEPLGSRVDRHEHIGKGQIGLDAFAFLLNDARFARIPKLLETPKTVETESDRMNLATLRGLLHSERSEESRERPLRTSDSDSRMKNQDAI